MAHIPNLFLISNNFIIAIKKFYLKYTRMYIRDNYLEGGKDTSKS